MDRTTISETSLSASQRETNRPQILLLIALGLVFYGIYKAAFVPAMFIGHTSLLLAIGFLAQVVFAIAAAVGVWRGQAWAPLALVLLGVSIAVTYLVEAFVLGIVAYLYALFGALVAMVVTLLLAAYVGGRR